MWSFFPPPLAKRLTFQGHHFIALTASLCKKWLWTIFFSFVKFHKKILPSFELDATLLLFIVKPQTSYLWANNLKILDLFSLVSWWTMHLSFDPERNPQSKVFSKQLTLEKWSLIFLRGLAVSVSNIWMIPY